MDRIYHYTSIESLEKIIKTKKIRFNNLNDVDDIRESNLFIKKSLAQFIFVSCWTKNPEENIPLWQMYTDGKGVRIGLPEYPWRKMNPAMWEIPKGFYFQYDNDTYSPFDFNDIYGKKHIIMMPYAKMWPNKYFAKEVEYLPEDELAVKYHNLYQYNTKGNEFIIQIQPKEFGLYKHIYWKFQCEYRFVLWIFPVSDPIEWTDQKSIERLVNEMYNHIEKEYPSPLKDFLLDLDPDVFDNMELIAGPLTTPKEMKEIERVLSDNNIKIEIKKSDVHIRK